MSLETIAFVGLGNMGAAMAKRLAGAGYALRLVDAAPGIAANLAGEFGAIAAPSLGAIAGDCDAIITMLQSSAIVDLVLDDKTLEAVKKGALVIEMSSGEPLMTRQIGQRLAARGVRLIDAPVSGGVSRATSGELTIMVGGDDADLAAAKDILSHMGSNIIATGPLGTGHAMKAINNLISAAGMIASVEGLLIGKRFGLDPSTMVDILNVSTGMTSTSQKKLKQFMISRTFDSGFGLDLMVKDVGIATDLAHKLGLSAPLVSLVAEMWRAAKALEVGPDHTAISLLSEKLAREPL